MMSFGLPFVESLDKISLACHQSVQALKIQSDH